MTMAAPRHSVFYSPDALPEVQPTALKQTQLQVTKAHLPSQAV